MEIAIIIILVIVIFLFVGACAYTGMDPASLALTVMLVCVGVVLGIMGAKAWDKYQAKKDTKPTEKKAEEKKAEDKKENKPLTEDEKRALLDEFLKKLNGESKS